MIIIKRNKKSTLNVESMKLLIDFQTCKFPHQSTLLKVELKDCLTNTGLSNNRLIILKFSNFPQIEFEALTL